MVSQNRADTGKQAKRDRDLDQLIKRLDMLDDRLDNMDSIMTSLIERVMGRPLVLEVTCPHCNQTVQVHITSGVRIRGKE